MYKTQSSKIVVTGKRGVDYPVFEANSTAATNPGDLITWNRAAGTVTPFATANSTSAPMYIAIENPYQTDAERRTGTDSADLPYASGATVSFTRIEVGYTYQGRATAATPTLDATLSTSATAGRLQLSTTNPRGVVVSTQATAGSRFYWEAI